MNSFGRLFRVEIFGESHGAGVGVVIDGCPAGVTIDEDLLLPDLLRRQGGNQLGTTPRKEADKPIFLSGIFNGKSTGAPITIFFENQNVKSADYESQRMIPRPGHADFVANKKYGGSEDYRGGGHFSARLTTALVAAGAIAKLLMPQINIQARISEVAGEANVDDGLQKALAAKDSVGAIVSCTAQNLPIGLGEPFFSSVESLIAHIVFAIPAVKGIEFGSGFQAARMFGSEHNDAIIDANGTTVTNHAGGITGGITNGNELVFKVAFKPTASTPKQQESFNWQTNQIEPFSIKGRHDLCVALRAPVIVEAVTAIVLADLLMLEQKIPRRL